jgi:uncharacterized protein (DUF1330 family)
MPATLTKYSGRYIVRGGKFETLDGNWNPKRLLLLEFPASNMRNDGTTLRIAAR